MVGVRVAAGLAASALVLAGTLSLFLPLPRRADAEPEAYRCVWEDGSVTSESYASAYAAFLSANATSATVERDGKTGEISFGEDYRTAERTLRSGSLAELLSVTAEPLSRLERAALYRATEGNLWYAGGWYVWTERGLSAVTSAEGNSLVLLSGSVTPSRLIGAGVTRLELRAEATFTAKTLVGTAVNEIAACPPYEIENGAVYLDTGTARRLIAALPNVRELTVLNADYADTGALLACTQLRSLTLPFVGTAPNETGSFYQGELAALFSDGTEYFVPHSLKEVSVSGGALTAHAFYRCNGLESVSLCGMSASNVHPDALIDCTELRLVHTPNTEINLLGEFTTRTAPCGCTVYER